MSKQERFEELVSAAADGELPAADRARLDAWLAEHPEGRELAAEFEALGRELDGLEPLTPPEDLRRSILDEVRGREARQRPAGTGAGWLGNLFGMSYMRYAGTFAAGVLVALALTSINAVSRLGPGDTGKLVGTIGNPDRGGLASSGIVRLDLEGLTSMIELKGNDRVLILDIQADSEKTIDFIAEFDPDTIRFTGFEQLPGTPADVVSQPGKVALQMSGQRRYVLHLDRAGDAATTVRVELAADGKPIVEENWSLGGK